MKNRYSFLIVLAITIVCAIFIYVLASRTPKIASIEITTILEKYQGMIKLRNKIELLKSPYKSALDSLMLEFQKELKLYEKDKSKMSSKEKEQNEKLLRGRQDQLIKFQEVVKKKIDEEERKITLTVLNEINDFVKVYGRHHKYTFVLGANGSGNLFYVDPDCDITNQILDGLNEQYIQIHPYDTLKMQNNSVKK